MVSKEIAENRAAAFKPRGILWAQICNSFSSFLSQQESVHLTELSAVDTKCLNGIFLSRQVKEMNICYHSKKL